MSQKQVKLRDKNDREFSLGVADREFLPSIIIVGGYRTFLYMGGHQYRETAPPLLLTTAMLIGFEPSAANEPVTSDAGFDAFLQDLTLKAREMWEERGGNEISSHEAMALNDVLTQWFGDKRPKPALGPDDPNPDCDYCSGGGGDYQKRAPHNNRCPECKGLRKPVITDDPVPADILQDQLLMVDIDAPIDHLEALTPADRHAAADWACSVHLSASDNNVAVPLKPAFLDQYGSPGQGGVAIVYKFHDETLYFKDSNHSGSSPLAYAKLYANEGDAEIVAERYPKLGTECVFSHLIWVRVDANGVRHEHPKRRRKDLRPMPKFTLFNAMRVSVPTLQEMP